MVHPCDVEPRAAAYRLGMTEQIYGGGTFGINPAENYERFFVRWIGAPVAERFIEHAAPREGDRVLDVACGTGVVTRLLADRVGKHGSVAGLDINPAMLAMARAVAGPQRSIAWHESSAESMSLSDGSFDLVTCGMGLQFFANKLAALREMRRVLAKDGRLAVDVPGPVPPVFGVIADALGRHIDRDLAGFCHIVFSLHEADELRELATAAGFTDPHVVSETLRLSVPPPAEFLWGYFACTPFAATIAAADPSRRTALEREVVEGLQPFVGANGELMLAVRMNTLTAT
jgi:ubiquinone/menaquinone biosynthesis C-methylase UbiE